MKSLFATLIFGIVLGVGCSSSSSSSRDRPSAASNTTFHREYPIKVVATVGMVADIVRNVGGDFVDVSQIMGAGVDPHLYKATRDDVQSMMDSDVVFYSGLMLEGKMSDVLVKIARGKPVVAVTEMIDETNLLEPEDFAGHPDPHVWMDVSAWSNCVGAVAKALADYDSKHAETYNANAAAYQQQLADLHAYGKKSIGSVPRDRRVLITSHDAFNYFGRAYDLDVQGVQGLSTESEAGLQRINELVGMISDQGIQSVFVESSVPRKNIEALVEGVRHRGKDVRIGGELYSDAMGPQGEYEGTYLGMLDHNITLVTRALGGDAPAKGLNGKLSHAAGPSR